MTSETIIQQEAIKRQKIEVAETIKRCNDLFPFKHKFNFPSFTASEAEKLNKEYEKEFIKYESKTLIKNGTRKTMPRKWL